MPVHGPSTYCPFIKPPADLLQKKNVNAPEVVFLPIRTASTYWGDMEQGQMARDMNLFVDDDGKAYHIYSSEENSTLHIAELDPTYTGYTGKYIRSLLTGSWKLRPCSRKMVTITLLCPAVADGIPMPHALP